jgi:uncharacterized membrane protein (UPF0127 family)
MSRLTDLPIRTLSDGRRVAVAASLASRRRGLAGLDALPHDQALHLPRCRSIHTIAMRFALDLVWLDRHGAVVRVDRDVPPRRLRTCRRARSVVEVNAGQADAFLDAGLGSDSAAGPGLGAAVAGPGPTRVAPERTR